MGVTALYDEVTLPFLPKLGFKDPITVTKEELQQIAASFVQRLSDAIASKSAEGVASLFVSDCLWRDLLALTWAFNTFFKVENVRNMLEARLEKMQVSNVCLSTHRDLQPAKFQPVPVLLMVIVSFDFETVAGSCIGIARLVPTPSANGIDWKVYTLFTRLNNIKGFPDKIGPNRRLLLQNYVKEREKELAFEHRDPVAIIIGGGHAAVGVAARLKAKDVPYLIIEKNPRIGDNWRNRYHSLTLHDFSWMATLPYMPYPADWPLFTPKDKFADFLDFYVKALDLNVWTSTTVTKVERDDPRDQWFVHVTKADGTSRVFHSKYVVAAMGVGEPYTPDIPGSNIFKGQIMHAYSYTSPREHGGKKVVVVGAATAGHDISQDYYEHGIDVTMVQRSSTCVLSLEGVKTLFAGAVENDISSEIRDLHSSAIPQLVLMKFQTLAMQRVRQEYKLFYDALENAGFKVNYGIGDAGIVSLGLTRQGGFYIDMGASQLVIDKKIKMKHGSIKEFTSDGMIFEDGSSLEADLVIWATGLLGPKSPLHNILPPDLYEKLPSYKLSSEGEMENAYTECGLPNFFLIMGNIPMCRVYSSYIALIIKGKEEGLFSDPYKYTLGV